MSESDLKGLDEFYENMAIEGADVPFMRSCESCLNGQFGGPACMKEVSDKCLHSEYSEWDNKESLSRAKAFAEGRW